MAIITDILSLGVAIQEWSDRKDIDALLLYEFVDLAGRRASLGLRVPSMERTILSTTSDGRLQIPDDFIELRRITGPASSHPKVLKYVPWDIFVDRSSGDSAGEPAIFSRQGNTWYIYPEVSDGESFRIDYYSTIEAISPANPTNWLLQMAPQVYLFGALFFLYDFSMDNERAAYWEAKFNRELERLQAIADQSEHRGSRLSVDKI